ncbi:MAG: helix-turn-helix domain-containing protein [Acidobacteriota bacterium]
MAPEEGWVGIEEVAAHLRVAKESIYRWVDSKSFPAHRVGRLLRFKLSEVDEWVTASGGDDSGSRSSGKTTEARPAGRKSNAKKKSRHG